MTTKNNCPQRDRPRWETPAGARPQTMTADLHDSLPEVAMLRTRVRIDGTRQTIPIVIGRVSATKYAVMQGRGFDVSKLHGAQVVPMVRAAAKVAP